MNHGLQLSTNGKMRGRHRPTVAVFALSIFAITACGSDDKSSSDATTTAAAAATTAAPAVTETSSPAADEFTEYCALATEMDSQESFPTAEQMTKYKALAPAEIADSANTAADALIPVVAEPVELFNVFAQDEVETAIDVLSAYEVKTCGLEPDNDEMAAGASEEIEADAVRVDVVAKDYSFDFNPEVKAGRTSFVLVNEGKEAHFMLIFKLKDGVTLDEALAMEDSSGVIEGEWGSKTAAPDGTDEEVVTFDLEPGTYGMVCFVPGPDGAPHAFLGMKSEFVVG